MIARRDGGRIRAVWMRMAAAAGALALVASVAATGPVTAAGERVTGISAGDGFSCAVISDGSVWCWGDNSHGQLGDGTTTERHEPVRVTRHEGGFVNDAIGVDAGEAHACAVTDAGAVWCWGYNDFGQLGDGTTTERHGAVPLTRKGGAAVATATGVAAGDFATCIRSTSGRAECAGWPSGDGTRSSRLRLVPVELKNGEPLKSVGSVSADDHECARSAGGGAWCWGANEGGKLGDGTKLDRMYAVRVTKAGGGALTDVTDIDAGELHSCARRRDGSAWCWGYNAWMAIGDGTRRDRTRSVRVKKAGGGYLAGVKDVDAGAHHSCARTAGQVVSCWGNNEEGSLGNGTRKDRSTATPVRLADGPFDGVQAISAGERQTCAIRLGGTAWCWGSNDHGQVGDGTTADRVHPVAVVPAWEAP